MALNLGELNAIIDADDRGFNRTIDRVHKAMDRTGKKMGGLSGLLGVLGKATAFSALATGAAGAASSLGPLLGLVGALITATGGLALASAAFAAGGAAAIGTLTIGFQGLGDALKGDEEALEKLAPAARDVVGVLKGLRPEWEGLVRSVQGQLFAGVAKDLKAVAGTWLPLMKTGLGQVADGWNTVFRSALKASGQTRVIDGFKDVLASTGEGLKAFARGISPALNGIGVILSAFAPLLVDAGNAAAGLAERFGAWALEAEKTGRLQELIESMKTTLGQLGGIAQNVGSILGSVFSAAGEHGGGLLGVIEDLTGRLSAFFDSAKGQEALNSFFASLAAVGDAVLPIILELAEVFGTDLAPAFAEIATAVGPSLRDLVQELGDAIGKIDAATLAGGFADILDAVIPLIEPLGNIIGWFSSIEGLVPVLVVALTAWTVAQWALNVAMYANPILLIITLIAALIAGIILLVVNWDSVTAALAVNWEWTKAKAEEVWGAIADFFRMIGTKIKDYFVAVWAVIRNNVVGTWNAITAFISAKVNEVLSIISWLGSLPGKVSGWFGSVKDAAVSKLNSLVDWVQGIPGKITSALGNLGSLLKDAGRDIINGLLNGIQEKFGAVQDKLSDLTNMLPDWKGPPEKDRTILGPAGEMVIGGFVDGLERAIPSVQRALAGLTSDIGLQVDAAAAPVRQEAPVTTFSDDDRQLLAGVGAMRGRTDQTFVINGTDADPGTLAAEMDWLSRRRP